ncbi:ATP-dependent helicase [Brevibacillus sp. NPDC058079]|uniref:ATP-dependent helicase n=1 Tax=Brevibacillus sp. NPDC058079 TaxID=3346330 RepID=UPI0036E64BB7
MLAEEFFEKKRQELGVVLSVAQRQAVEHTEGPELILASPGSGKTTVIIMKIGYLIEVKNVDPSRIRAVTFSNASAEDMDKRFDKFFPYLSKNKVKFSTIHSFAFEVVRHYFRKSKISYQLIEGETDKERLNGGDGTEQVLNKKWILRKIFRDVTGENITDDQMEDLLSYISYVKNKLIPRELLKEVKTDVPSAVQIFTEYEAFKNLDNDKQLVDFDDMLIIANRALEEDRAMLEYYQQMFDYFLTDESQDNSLVQNKIVEKLVSAKRNLCVVADDDQSIYGWRGAAPDYLLNFKSIYPDAAIIYMEQNYRSSKDVVDIANQFIKRNKNRYDKNMFTEKGLHAPIKLTHLDTHDAQIRHVIEKVKALENLKEVAILYRNNASSISLIDELDHCGIPFYIKDSDNKFFNHWIIEDILNFMRISYSDKYPAILERIHTKFNGYITKRQIDHIKGLDNGESVFDNLLGLDLPLYQRKQLKMCKDTFQKINGMRPDRAIRVIRDTLGYDKNLTKMSERLGFSKEYLFGILNTLEGIGSKLESLKDFAERLNYLRSLLKVSKFNKHKGAVTLSTFHSSKGLEFDHVFMIDLVDGVIPSNDIIKDFKDGKIDEMEEEVRLFYVGMTRARFDLELLSYRRKDGESLQESIFVKDVKKIMFPNQSSEKTLNKPKKVPATINPNAYKDIRDVVVGDKVKHTSFGIGFVERVDNQMIGIRFEGLGIKNLAVDMCLEKGLLEPAPITEVC